jgi:hypothetical protein
MKGKHLESILNNRIPELWYYEEQSIKILGAHLSESHLQAKLDHCTLLPGIATRSAISWVFDSVGTDLVQSEFSPHQRTPGGERTWYF